jgi:hypothetical protein
VSTDRQAEIDQQTRIRRALLAGGYTPLANKDKMCILLGWSSLVVTEALIETWSDAWKYRGTGVRLDNGLCMVDMDINDEAMVVAICDTMPDDLWALFGEAPRRFGRGAKEAWFVRVDRPFVRWASAAYFKAEDDDDAPLQRLECFANSGRQAGAFGAHTIGADGSVEVAYRWADDISLVDIPLAELPLVTVEHIERLCDHVTQVMAKAGWRRKMNLRTGETTEAEVFDLHDAMVFDTVDGEMSLFELGDAVQGGSLRLSASWLEGPVAKNTSRCIASARHDGGLQIFETADCVMHRPAEDRAVRPREGLSEKLARLQAAVDRGEAGLFAPTGRTEAETVDGEEAEGEQTDIMEAVVNTLLQDYAFCRTDLRAPIYPLDGAAALNVTNFKLDMAAFAVTTKGKRGAETTVHPVDLWMAHPERINVVGRDYRPDAPGERVAWDVDQGGLVVNTYRAPSHEAVPDGPARDAALALWQRYIEHLVPDAGERHWLVNKLASKVQRPELPGVVTLMVAPHQGTGRGTLFVLLEFMFGRRNCITLDRNKLFGKEGQGQYTDWRAGRLFGFVHELLAGDSGGGFQHRRLEMYEHLKVVGDPAAMAFDVVEKYQGTRAAVAHVSLMIATNHLNALPIQYGDRRIAVIRGGAVKLDDVPALRAMHAAKTDPLFAAVVWEVLAAVEVDWDMVMQAPMFEGREAMIEENTSDLDTVISDVLERLPGDFITIGALRDQVKRRLTAEGLEDEAKWHSRMSNMLSAHDNPTGWVFLRKRYPAAPPGASTTAGALLKVQIVARGEGGHARFSALSMHERYLSSLGAGQRAELASAIERARVKGIGVVSPPE